MHIEFARIAQMESSRIVGGRARTQDPLRAPRQNSSNSALTRSSVAVRATLERGKLAQAALDILAVGSAILFACSGAAAFGWGIFYLFFGSVN